MLYEIVLFKIGFQILFGFSFKIDSEEIILYGRFREEHENLLNDSILMNENYWL